MATQSMRPHRCPKRQLRARLGLTQVLVAFAAACIWVLPGGTFSAPSRQSSLSQAPGGAVDLNPPKAHGSNEELWQSLFASPSNWVDFRAAKEEGRCNAKSPDFKSADGGALWIDSKGLPGWVPEELKTGRDWKLFGGGKSAPKGGDATWDSLFNSPAEWEDCRSVKNEGTLKPSFPDFKRVDGAGSLWLTSKEVPDWAAEKLNEGAALWQPYGAAKAQKFTGPRKTKAEREEAARLKDELLEDLIENPEKWIDYREAKKAGSVSPKCPDFKNQAEDKPLWLSDKIPNLILKMLDSASARCVKAKVAASTEPLWQSVFESPKEWIDLRERKQYGDVNPKSPDFKKAGGGDVALWLDSRGTPSWVLPKLEAVEAEFGSLLASVPVPRLDQEKWWKSLFEEPGTWVDCRSAKKKGIVSPTHPDFTHPTSDSWLHVDSAEMPSWVRDKLKLCDSEDQQIWQPYRTTEELYKLLWNNLFTEPGEWTDMRDAKREGLVNKKYPDFKPRNKDQQALWISSSSTSLDVIEKLEKLASEKKKSPWALYVPKETMWKDLLEGEAEWIDYREDKMYGKVSPRHPDFKHPKHRDWILWVDSKDTPQWALERLEELDSNFLEQSQGKGTAHAA